MAPSATVPGNADAFTLLLSTNHTIPFLKVMDVRVCFECPYDAEVVAFRVLAGEPMLTMPEDQTLRRL